MNQTVGLKVFLSSLAITVLAGCVSAPSSKAPDISYQPGWTQSGVAKAEPIDAQWWQTFGDPTLTQLIELAGAQNYDYRIAKLKLNQARAASQLTTADRLPSVSAEAQATKRKASANGAGGLAELAEAGLAPLKQNVFNAGLDASYEIDLFGGNRSDARAADAQILQAYYGSGAVLLSVYSDIAASYFRLRAAQNDLGLLNQQIQIQSKLAKIESQLTQIGASDQIQLSRAEQTLAEITSGQAALVADLQTEQMRLSLLTGQAPESLSNLLTSQTKLPELPTVIQAGLRSELLTRRPDLQAAKAALQLQSAELAQAVSEQYPKFALSAQAGLESTVFSSLGNAASGQWAIGGFVQWPIFAQGRIRANIEVQGLEQEQAVLEYEQALLSALSETETSFNRYAQSAISANNLGQAADQATRQNLLSTREFEAGSISKKTQLANSIAALQTQRTSIQAHAQALIRLIAVYKSLGGGWGEKAFEAQSHESVLD